VFEEDSEDIANRDLAQYHQSKFDEDM